MMKRESEPIAAALFIREPYRSLVEEMGGVHEAKVVADPLIRRFATWRPRG